MATPKHTPELSVVRAEDEASASELAVPFLELEIRRGKTGYPSRSVCSRNFVIGSGPGSDLRLGGDGIPVAHTVLIVAENQIFAQWLSESPPLVLNGQPIQEAELCEGDQLEIGRFAFIVHRILTKAVSDENHPAALPNTKFDTADLLNLLGQTTSEAAADNLAELSATELAESLEAEQNSVEQFENAVRDAEAALLYAVGQRAEDLMAEENGPASTRPKNDDDDAEILGELERVIRQLNGFSSELELRASRIAAEEATQAQAAELLLDAQKELASQLERFQREMSVSQEHPEPKLRRAA